MRVLHFYFWGNFHPVTCGADAVVVNQMRYFQKRGWEVDCLLPKGYGMGWGNIEPLLREFPCIRSCREVPGPGCSTDLREVLLFLEEGARSKAFRGIAREGHDLFFGNYAFCAPLAHALPARCFKVVETHDRLSRMFREITLREKKLTLAPDVMDAEERMCERHVESALYQFFDRAIMISPQEEQHMRQLGCANARYVPQNFELPAAVDREPALYDLLFFGSNNPFNREGIQWFYREVYLPFLAPRGIRWAVAGKACEALPETADGVIKLGHWDRPVHELYALSKLVVAPIFQGTGIAIKVFEALAAGSAVFTTPVGARGLPLECDVCVRFEMRESPRRAADMILEVLTDKGVRAAYGRRGRKYIEDRHSEEVYFQSMDEVLAPLVSGPRKKEQLAAA